MQQITTATGTVAEKMSALANELDGLIVQFRIDEESRSARQGKASHQSIFAVTARKAA
ncbi:MAG: hypothetical protein ABSF23_12895 [Terracidiphilus sp.]|jgi:hypothetical protein